MFKWVMAAALAAGTMTGGWAARAAEYHEAPALAALVAQGKTADAAAALAEARRDAPQNPDGWLLSATLARRSGDLGAAQAQIETAAGLDPKNPQVGLEAGVIAALAGRDDAARKSWQSVIDTSPGTPEADTANAYIAEVGAVPAAPPAAPENSR